jgi:NAD(P)-dependent dehydrogenase (short-subunit alcohol dehydrogenase family)
MTQDMKQDLKNQRVVVTGVTGNVGWGVAHAMLARGANVVAVTRHEESAAGLRATLAVGDDGGAQRLQVVVGDLSDGTDAIALRDRVLSTGQVSHVVASLGAWWQKGAIVEQTPQEFREVREGALDAQVHCAMAFLPGLRHRAGTSYTLITGAAGHMAIANTGLLVVTVCGVLGLSRMLRAEHAHDAVRVNEVLISARIEREARPGVVPAAHFGQAVADIAASDQRGAVLGFDAEGGIKPT